MNYACGNWLKSSSAQEDITQTWAQSSLMTRTIAEAVDAIDVDEKNIPKFKIRVKTFFDQCKNHTNLENRNATVKELFTTLVKILGTPPILTSDEEKREEVLKRNVWKFLGQVQRELPAVKIFFSASVEIVANDCTGNKAVLMFVGETWDKNRNRLNPQQVFKYIHFMADLLQVKLDSEEALKKIDSIIEFENELINFYNITEKAAVSRAKVNNQTELEEEKDVSLEDTITLEHLEALNPNISWSQYFRGLFSKDQHVNWNQSAPLILIRDREYFELLDEVVNKFDSETIFNYIFYQSILQFYKSIINESSSETDESQCADLIKDVFKSASTYIVFDHLKLDPEEFRHDIELILETIFSAFKFLVFGSDWLNAEEKLAIIDKANQITFYTGIPDWFKNESEIERRTIAVSQGASTVENYITLMKQNFDHDLDLIIGIGDVNAEDEPDLVVNAYYLSMHITLHAGYIIPPLYHPKYPLSLKYAHIGNILGHELMHAFDADGVDEVPPGAKTWLKKDTMQTFTRKRDCLIKQYSAYCFKKQKMCLSGRRTISENMADMDGLKIAYMAYKFAVQTIGEEPPIPGFLDLSGDQLFFLATVRTQCSTGGEVESTLSNIEETHAPDQARVDVPFRNFPIFSKLFKCEVGSFYAPLQTCSLWGAYNAGGRRSLFN